MSTLICFWRGSILFVGEMPDLPLHAHIAATVCAGVNGEIRVRGRGLPQWSRRRTAFIPSDAPHEIRLDGARFASLLAEPGTEAFRCFDESCHSSSAHDASDSQPAGDDPALPIRVDPPFGRALLRTLTAIESAKSDMEIETALAALLPPGAGDPTDPDARDDACVASMARLDPRLKTVTDILLASPEDTLPVEELAAAIGMSTSWLLHAFKARFGVPLRRFRTWFRLKSAALLLKQGDSLASAAVGAGFYDQAHFNNAFRDLFGIQPGTVFNRKDAIHWFVDEASLTRQLLSFSGENR